MSQLPIGVFDSGVGGLSVLQQIAMQMPHEAIVYVGDNLYAPYGDKPDDMIATRVGKIADFLLSQSVKSIVIACNTATSAAVSALRETCPVPVFAIEPAIKPAVALSRSGKVAVLATQSTINSENLARLASRYSDGAEVILQACPGLVERVERGERQTPALRQALEGFVMPLLERGVDTLVLGCTHYPFLRDDIVALVGDDVRIIEPADAVARHIKHSLAKSGQLSSHQGDGKTEFFVSGDRQLFAQQASVLMGRDILAGVLPARYC